jgi:ectoine hydroxylase-related dioxygenase (phytanoyl-CoA dioxygenase family)
MYFGTWTALESTDAANGPLIVIPGSHRLPLLDRNAIAHERYQDLSEIKDMDDDLWSAYQHRINDICQEKGLVAEEVHVEKGDTIIWHPLLAHGGAKIQDQSRTRLSFVVHTTPRNTPVYHTDVFFDVNRRVRKKAPWSYDQFEGRWIMRSNSLTIGHAHQDFDFSQLR